jgi:hypothetical protein
VQGVKCDLTLLSNSGQEQEQISFLYSIDWRNGGVRHSGILSSFMSFVPTYVGKQIGTFATCWTPQHVLAFDKLEHVAYMFLVARLRIYEIRAKRSVRLCGATKNTKLG